MPELSIAPPVVQPVAIIIPQGKTLDFIDGRTFREETPEEYVRQEISKSLVREYRYPRSSIAVEFTIRIGTRKPRADIVIFAEGAEQKQEHSYLIVECKAPTVQGNDRKEGFEQLKSYLAVCPNAAYGMWTNGLERHCFRRVVKDGVTAFEDLPDIPAFGQRAEDIERPRFDQLVPASSDALLFDFRRCHNDIASTQGLQKPEAFWELLKLIFCKIHDERHSPEVEFYAGMNELSGMLGRMKVKARLDRLFEAVKKEYPSIFATNDTIVLQPDLLANLVKQLQKYILLASDVDVKGHAYEEIVGANLRGDRGEYFTPRNICNMAVAMLEPREDQLILDPACGTGGFLIAAMNHVIRKVQAAELQRWGGNAERADRTTEERVKLFARERIVGIDFNPNLVKATKMNMVMNNDGEGGLYQANSLASPATWEKGLHDRSLLGRVDLIFTNPPFGSKLLIKDQAILEKYALGHSWSYDPATDQWIQQQALQERPPEILFIERCVQFLKPGTGRVAMVLPDGILGGPGLGFVREWILTQTRVLASIDLHPDTFQPSVSVQTSLLVMERKTDQEIALESAAKQKRDYPVFMAMANHIGHDKRGHPTYVRDRRGNEIIEEYEETILEQEGDMRVYRKRKSQRKALDDNTLQIAQVFRKWLSERD